jgi:hypothetical protein
MRRRDVILGLASSATAWPRAGRAERALPQIESAWVDGLANAPTGTPQFPNLLNNYHPAGQSPGRNKSNGRQPPFNVPGVDYRVGVQTGVVLKNVGTMNIPGVSVSGNIISVTGNNVVIDGYDCSNYTIEQAITAQNTTIRNCRWVQTIELVPIAFHGIGGYVGYCSIDLGGFELRDRGCILWNGAGMVAYGGPGNLSGNWVVEYCEMFNAGVDMLHSNGDSTGPGSLTLQYNYFHDNAVNTSAAWYHPDLVQILDGSGNWTFKYWNNLYYSPNYQSQGLMTPGNAKYPSLTCQNVLIGVGGWWFSCGTSSLTGTQKYTLHDNYCDKWPGSGVSGYNYHDANCDATKQDLVGNKKLTTGATWR